jgi:hypothetical protein
MTSEMFQSMIETTKARIEFKRKIMAAVEEKAQAEIGLLDIEAANLEAELKNLEAGLEQVKMAEAGIVGGRISLGGRG